MREARCVPATAVNTAGLASCEELNLQFCAHAVDICQKTVLLFELKELVWLDMYFGRDVWDPLLISAQIVANQCSFYFVLCLWLTFLSALSGHALNLSLIFASRSVSVHHVSVWVVVIANVLALPVWFVDMDIDDIIRSRQCVRSNYELRMSKISSDVYSILIVLSSVPFC